MSCPKREKERWFFKLIPYQPDCDFEVKAIGKFMSGVGNYFMVESKCGYCGRPHREQFVTWDSLLNRGVDNDYIEAAEDTWVYLDNDNQLNKIKERKKNG